MSWGARRFRGLLSGRIGEELSFAVEVFFGFIGSEDVFVCLVAVLVGVRIFGSIISWS